MAMYCALLASALVVAATPPARADASPEVGAPAAPDAGAPAPDSEGGDAPSGANPEEEAARTEVLAALDGGATLELRVGHTFAREAAKERIGYLLDYWRGRFGVRSTWRGFRVFLSGRILGADLKAFFDVGEAAVAARAVDPGFLGGQAIDYVERKLRKYLHPGYAEP